MTPLSDTLITLPDLHTRKRKKIEMKKIKNLEFR